MLTHPEEIKKHLDSIVIPYLDCSLLSAKAIKKINIDRDEISVELQFGFPTETIENEIKQIIENDFKKVGIARKINFEIRNKLQSHAVQSPLKTNAHIKNIIAVASGKGGVGKSTTSVNLALALSQLSVNVGLLDADIYGPNQPQMLGVKKGPEPRADKKFNPINIHGIQTMSIGYLINPETPMIWRGPMVSGALQQLMNDTLWEDLDYLIIDLPPGTGDIQLTLSQKIPVSGAVIVTTPQDVALLDARKGLEMFRKVNVPVLGIIENMSTYICPSCGHQEYLFGKQGGENLSKDTEAPLLGRLPLKLEIREAVDQGNPTVVSDPQSEIAHIYKKIALTMVAKLSLQPVHYASKFPNIVVE